MRALARYPWGVWVLCAFWLIGCTTVPETGRTQLNLLSEQQESKMGHQAFSEMKEEMPINEDPEINAMVQEVGERIAAVADPDIPDADWEFVVFEQEDPNAFALPGGKVGVFTGILELTQDEAGLATIIGHEVAHVAARHGGERVSQAMLVETGGQLLRMGLSETSPQTQKLVSAAYGIGALVGYQLPHTRDQESEADQIGLLYMARAGYDPQAAVDFWQRFAEYSAKKGGNVPGFLRTHPVDEVRIRQIKKWMPEAKQEYREATTPQ